MKKIYENSIKLMKVCKQMLKKIKFDSEPFTSVLFKRVAGLEDNDSIEEIYDRRMGLKDYFKHLKMNL
jgi:hypothetical protein